MKNVMTIFAALSAFASSSLSFAESLKATYEAEQNAAVAKIAGCENKINYCRQALYSNGIYPYEVKAVEFDLTNSYIYVDFVPSDIDKAGIQKFPLLPELPQNQD